ncbi:MAG: DinB family protein [Anaerolineae bacterium]
MPSSPGMTVFCNGWQTYQHHLVEAIGKLNDEQLALRVDSNQRSISEITRHMIATRARWFRGVLGQGGDKMEAFADWQGPDAPSRSASEMVEGLNATWDVVGAAVGMWTTEEMVETVSGEWRGRPFSFTRAWVVWHVLEHDLHHGGEISLTLGAHGLPGLNI